MSDRKILQQTPQQLAGLPSPQRPKAVDPRYLERPTDVKLTVPIQMVHSINIRIALMEAPIDILVKARDQINELINMRKNGRA